MQIGERLLYCTGVNKNKSRPNFGQAQSIRHIRTSLSTLDIYTHVIYKQ